jgi:hypothetical protein
MKKDNKNKTEKKVGHNVETPAPPQVMDPTVPPTKNGEHKSAPKKKARTNEKTKEPGEKLAPNEEL